jgi:hypothetical protein
MRRTSFGSPPPALTVYIADALTGATVLFARMKAIRRPSGDELGEWSSVPEFGSSWVSWRTFEPSASMTKIPTIGGGPALGAGPSARSKAMRRPSGDQTGYSFDTQSPVQPARLRLRTPVRSGRTTSTSLSTPKKRV